MPWYYVQRAAKGKAANPSAGQVQSATAFLRPPAVGNLLVTVAWGWGGTVNSPGSLSYSDNVGGNTWTNHGIWFQSGVGDAYCGIGSCRVAATAGGFAPRVTVTGSCTSVMVVGMEFTNPAVLGTAGFTLDGSPTGRGNVGTSINPGNLTVAVGSLVVAVGAWDATSQTPVAPTGGFFQVDSETNGTTYEVGSAAFALGPNSPSNPTWTQGSGLGFAAGQVAFVAGAGGVYVFDASWFPKQVP